MHHYTQQKNKHNQYNECSQTFSSAIYYLVRDQAQKKSIKAKLYRYTP